MRLLFLVGVLMSGLSFAQYEVGQVWQYETREGEEKSRLYIAHIDQIENYGNIYHIRLDGLLIKNPHITTGFQADLPHIPVSKETLDASVTKLSQSNVEMPDISEGHGYWQEAFGKGEGGVFTVPIDQIIQFVEEALNQAAVDYRLLFAAYLELSIQVQSSAFALDTKTRVLNRRRRVGNLSP